MSTALDLISRSLRLLGVLASGESPSSDQASDALSSLNDMIDSWSNENLLIPNKIRETFNLVAGQQTYTMGVGGNFNTVRAQKIENALIQPPNSSTLLEIPMKILTKDQYAGIIIKTLESTFPLYMYAEGVYPLDNLNFWPVPNVAAVIALYSWKPLTDLASLTTTLSLPPGYNRMLRYALAVELSAEYGKELPESILGIATDAKANIKRMNSRPKYLMVDDQLRAKPAVWNWMTGEPT